MLREGKLSPLLARNKSMTLNADIKISTAPGNPASDSHSYHGKKTQQPIQRVPRLYSIPLGCFTSGFQAGCDFHIKQHFLD